MTTSDFKSLVYYASWLAVKRIRKNIIYVYKKTKKNNIIKKPRSNVLNAYYYCYYWKKAGKQAEI